MKTNTKLRRLNPCAEGLKYAEFFGSLQKAWDACERGDWMLWLLGRLSGPPESESRKELVLIACKCARTALKYVAKGEKRPLKAIQTAEKWAEGKATIEEVREANSAAYAASASTSAYAASASTSAYAAYAASAYAAYAVYAASVSAAYAASASAAYAASAAAAYAAAAYAAAASASAASAASASAASAASASAASAATRTKVLKKCAGIVRKMHPKAPRITGKEE